MKKLMRNNMKNRLLLLAFGMLFAALPDIYAQFAIGLTGMPPTCHGFTNGSVTATVFGGQAPFTYLWDNGQQGATNLGLGAGTVSVTITDASGFQVSDSFTLSEPNPLEVSLLIDDVLCHGFNDGVIKAPVTGGVSPYTFNWNPAQGNQQILTNLPPGVYELTVTDANNCSAIAWGAVNEPDPLDVELISVTPSCGGGNTGSATVQASGGVPPYKYVWSDPMNQMGPTATGLEPGQYYVCTFDANNCQYDIFVTIPDGDGLDIDLILTKAECVGVDNGIATVLVNPPVGNYMYVWNIAPNANTNQITGIAAGTFIEVTVTDLNTGCQAVANGVMGTHNQIKVAVTDTDIQCAGDQTGSASAIASLGTAPYQYVWTFPDGSTVNGPDISGLSAGAYQVVATDDRGCTAVGVADINVLSDLNAAYELTLIACEPDSITAQFTDLSSDGASTIVSWQWTIVWPDNNLLINQQQVAPVVFAPFDTGYVVLVVTSAAGCVDTAQGPFMIPDKPDIQLSVPPVAINCDGGPVEIEVIGSSGYTYVWTPADFLTFVNGNPQQVVADPPLTTQYTVTASLNGCINAQTVTVVKKDPLELSLGANQLITCEQEPTLTATVNQSANIIWTNATGDVLGNNASLTVIATTDPVTYYVQATDNFDCAVSDSVSVTGLGVDVEFNLAPPSFICTGDVLTIEAVNLDPGDTLTYAWTSVPALLNITPTDQNSAAISGPAGNYVISVTVRNQHDCEETLSVPLNIQDALNLADVIQIDTCEGLLVSFSVGGGVTGTWDFGDSTTSNQPNVTHTYASPGIYNVQFIPDATDCIAPYADAIQVLEESAIQVSLDPNNGLDCNNGEVQVVVLGSPTLTYVWTPVDDLTFVGGDPQNVIANPSETRTYTLTALLGACEKSFPFTVTRITPLELELDAGQGLVCGDQAALNLQINANADVIWTIGANTVGTGLNITLPAGMTPQLVTATATDQFGCETQASITVQSLAVDVEVTGSGSLQLCANESGMIGITNLDPNDVLTYAWSANGPLTITPADGPSVSISGPQGAYVASVIVNNQFNCPDTLQFPVSVQENIVLADLVSLDLCKGLEVTFSNNSGVTGVWDFGDGSPTSTQPSPTHTYGAVGTYTPTFTPDPGQCADLYQQEITVNDEPLAANFNFDYVNCKLEAIVSFNNTSQAGAGMTTVSWKFSNDTTSTDLNPIIRFAEAGVYTVKLVVTDINGCMDSLTADIPIELINLQLPDDLRICPGENVALNPSATADYVFEWTATPADPTLNPTLPNPVVSPATPTTYVATVSNENCIVSDTISVVLSEAAVATFPADHVLCQSGVVQLSVSSPNANLFEWSQNPGFDPVFSNETEISVNTPSPGDAATYYVRVVTPDGCEAQDSATVRLGPAEIGAQGLDRKVCLGEATTLEVLNLQPGDVLDYTWTPALPNTSSPSVAPTTNTTYTVVATNQYGCSDTLSFFVGVAAATVSATANPVVVFSGELSELNASAGGGTNYIYTWTPSATLNLTDVPNPEARPEETTIYTVSIVTEDGCVASDTVLVTVRNRPCLEPYIFIPTAFTPNGDGFNDIFRVRGDEITEIHLIIWNRWGEIIFETKELGEGWDGSYQGRSLTPDAYAYYVRLLCEGGEELIRKGNVTLLK